MNDHSGWLYSSQEAKWFFNELFDEFKRHDVKEWVSTTVKDQFEVEFEKGLLDRPTTEFFVPPPLHRHVFVEGKVEELDTFEKEEITFEELTSTADNVLLQAHPEYGKTTLLQQMCIRSCSNISTSSNDRHFIPVLLKFSDFAPGTKRIERAIRNALPDLPASCAIGTLLRHGAFTICVDDVLLTDR